LKLSNSESAYPAQKPMKVVGSDTRPEEWEEF
jgi:hypothetical protein